MAYEFPYLSLNSEHSTEQATMLLRAFGHQTVLFENIQDTNSGLNELIVVASLIGFSILVLSWVFQKIDPPAMLAWAALFLICITGAFGERLFFTPLEPGGINWLESPYCVIEGSAICPANFQTPAAELEEEGISVEGSNGQRGIMMYSPQVWAIHYLNVLRAELAVALRGISNEGLSSRMQALRMAQYTRVSDYRPHYDMAMFMQMCGQKVPELMNQDWTQSVVWLSPEEASAAIDRDVDTALKNKLRQAPITLGDIVDANRFFWNERERASVRVTGSVANAASASVGIGMPPLSTLSREDISASCPEIISRLNTSSPASVASCEGILNNANRTIFFDDFSSSVESAYREIIETASLEVKNNLYNSFIPTASNNQDIWNEMRKTPTPFVHAVVNDIGQIESDASWYNGSLFGLIYGGTGEIATCADFHKKVVASFQRSVALQGEYTREINDFVESRTANMQGIRGEDLPYDVRSRVAFHAAIEQIANSMNCYPNGAGFGYLPPSMDGMETCGPTATINFRRQAQRIQNHILSSAMINSRPDVEAIIAESGEANGYFSPVREFASGVGAGLAPVAVFFKGLFGGFEAGTYSAIMPALITWFITLTIIVTPLIYMVGLLIPQWSTGVFITPIITVVYFKSVELSFMLIHQIFEIVGGSRSGLAMDTGTTTANFHDILLGMAYTSAFAVSLVLLFGLRNPAGLIQGLAGKVDNLAKVSTQEALAMAGTAMAAVKMGAAVLPGGAAVKALGSVAGMASDVADKGVTGSIGQAYSDNFEIAKHNVQQGTRERYRSAQTARKVPLEDFQSIDLQTNAVAADTIEKRIELEGKGMGVSGADRKGKTYQKTLPNGQTVTVQADPANLQLAEAIGKELGKSLSEAGRIANKLMASGAVSAQYNVGDKQVQFSVNPRSGERTMQGLGDVGGIKAAIDKINNK